jgi:uncharacterized protein YcnI
MSFRAHRWVIPSLAAIAALLISNGALAHITLNPNSVNAGSFAKFDVRVPNERPDAGTVKVEVQFPQDQALPFVSVKPHAGWKYTVQTRKLDTPITQEGETINEVVSQITWEADSGVQIGPGEFDEFEISAGPMPDQPVDLVFKAIQTYSSGEVVRWIDAPDAATPAPIVKVVAATDSSTTGPAGPQGPVGESGGGTIAIVALIVGALGLVTGGAALLKTKR